MLIGNRKPMNENSIAVSSEVDLTLKKLEQDGKTAVLISVDGKLSGIVAMADTLKQSAKEAISSLTQMGIQVVMLTGDNERTRKQ